MRYRKTFREAWADVHRNRGSKHISADKEEPSKEKSSGDEIQNLKNQIQMLKIALENEKNKAVKPEPNKDTGEIPLRTGIAHAILDKNGKSEKVIAKKNKKEKVSVGKGQTKIEVDPDVSIGIASSGGDTGKGNLH